MNPVVIEDANSEGGRYLTSQRPNHNFTATRVVDNNGGDHRRSTGGDIGLGSDSMDYIADAAAHEDFGVGPDATDHIADTAAHGVFGVGSDATDYIADDAAHEDFGVGPDATNHIADTDTHGVFGVGSDATHQVTDNADTAPHGKDGNCPDALDHVANLDADTFEILAQVAAQPTNQSGAAIPEQGPSVGLPTSPTALEDQEQVIAYAEAAASELSALAIDKFPFGSPGAPIEDLPPGFSQ
ncbi:hypothetical protein BC826DRAFT_975160, partial [Russula brevipes]